MRDNNRIKRIVSKLENIWENNSDMRFGQLLINLGVIKDDNYVWHREDDVLEGMLK